MSMRSHYDPIHDSTANSHQTRVNISSLLANEADETMNASKIAIINQDSDSTMGTEKEDDDQDDDDEDNEEQEGDLFEFNGSIQPTDHPITAPVDPANPPMARKVNIPLTAFREPESLNGSTGAPPSGTFSNLQTPTKPMKMAFESPTNVNKVSALLNNESPAPIPPTKAKKSPNYNHLNQTLHKRVNQTLIISAKQHHIKKKDGQPFWRKDIQYEFLKQLFEEPTKAFTNPFQSNKLDGETKMTFSELYISLLAYSNKTSKILRERLLTDRVMAVPVCMVALLVNVGRMNTTVNFVPEMKSQLRTFHSIPVLQLGKNSANNKTLQDSPRIKSILKSWSEANKFPVKFEDFFKKLNENDKPNTNVINILFMIGCHEHLIKYHFNEENVKQGINTKFIPENTPIYNLNSNDDLLNPSNAPFSSIFLNSDTAPSSRVKRFLWILYNYVETNFTFEEISQNPFKDDDDPFNPPKLIPLPEGTEIDIDTPEEIKYAKEMENVRLQFLISEGSLPEGSTIINNHEQKEEIIKDESIQKAIPPTDSSIEPVTNPNKIQLNLKKVKKVQATASSTKNLKLTRAEKRSLDNGTSQLIEFDANDIFNSMYKENRFKQKVKRHFNGNILYFDHLMEKEDPTMISKPVNGKSKNGNSNESKKRSYNGDFGEFTGTCVKMFKSGKQKYEEFLSRDLKKLNQDVQIKISLGEDNKIGKVILDVD